MSHKAMHKGRGAESEPMSDWESPGILATSQESELESESFILTLVHTASAPTPKRFV